MNIEPLKQYILAKLKSELSSQLTYHNVHHTELVYSNCKQYIKRLNINAHDAFLLRTAALMHDTGYLFAHDDHEDHSIEFTRQILPGWNYSDQQIEIIAGMISATKIPQKPTTILEQIIGDSDLDYLGTDDFYPISETLYSELKAYNKIANRDDWNKLQVNFLQHHTYHTDFAKKYREPVKQKHLKELIDNLI